MRKKKGKMKKLQSESENVTVQDKSTSDKVKFNLFSELLNDLFEKFPHFAFHYMTFPI